MGKKYISTIGVNEYKDVFTEKNKNIVIKFDELFQNPDFKSYNVFVMGVGKKRVYSLFAKTMCKENNKILGLNRDISERFLSAYFAVKKAIDDSLFVKTDSDEELSKYGTSAKRDFGHYESFINFMISNIFTRPFIELVKRYVDENYKDEDENKNVDISKFNPGMTFTTEQLKMIIDVSILSRFAIPLCTHYIYVNSDKHIKVYSFMHTVIDALFKIIVVDTNTTNLIDKLYMFVTSSVKATEPSNKLIWEKFPMYNETRESIIEDLVEKIITTILLKFELKNPIKLISVVSRDSVGRFKIRAKNPFDCYRISDSDKSSDDEDRLSETDMFDKYCRVTDENITILNRYANDDTIDIICRRNNIVISDEEYQFYLMNYNLHNFTVMAVSNIFARFFSGVANVRSCTFPQFIKLMIVLVHKMRDLDINYLPYFLTGNRESYSFTKMPSSTVMKELKSDIDYNQLIDLKYKYIHSVFEIKAGMIEEKNPILDTIVGLIHNNYVYNEYGNKLNGTPIEFSEKDIIHDVIQMYKKMII